MAPAKTTRKPRKMNKSVCYEKWTPEVNAKLALNYLTSMVDPKYDWLPYWLIRAHENPSSASHCRVDDAELVASWYEAMVATRDILGTKEGKDQEDGFYRHLMKSWGPKGLRYHENYPWSKTNHSSFHEMAYILSALNRVLQENPKDKMAEKRAKNLVRGMRSLVIERKMKTFWSGDYKEPEKIYEFPNDVYLRKGGWDYTRHTGRGEHSIRNGMMLHALAVRYDMTGDKAALDLATGIANHLLGVSRYFNYKMEFFGHVHSAVWVASGLARLGRVTKNQRYIDKARQVYDYIRSLSSSWGWVPEYAQWHPMSEEHCETCCIKDMIECAAELIDCGYDEYWIDLDRFSRNQLSENQVKDGCFVAVDNTKRDNKTTTYKDIDKRIVGGWSGGAEPNSISLQRFRSIAGCCVGTAPQALQIVWHRHSEYKRNRFTLNLPWDKDTRNATVEVGYPNDGFIRITPKRDCEVAIRTYEWMPKKLSVTVNGKKKAFKRDGDLLVVKGVKKGQTVELKHRLSTVEVKEHCAGRDWKAKYRGPDVIDLTPKGEPLRLFQRVEGKKKVYPKAPKKGTDGGKWMAVPTQQKG